MQAFLIGALAVQLVDRTCRRPYLVLEQDFVTLFALCQNLDGYGDVAAANRRETAAKMLASIVQRDPEGRRCLVISGALKNVLSLLNPVVRLGLRTSKGWTHTKQCIFVAFRLCSNLF